MPNVHRTVRLPEGHLPAYHDQILLDDERRQTLATQLFTADWAEQDRLENLLANVNMHLANDPPAENDFIPVDDFFDDARSMFLTHLPHTRGPLTPEDRIRIIPFEGGFTSTEAFQRIYTLSLARTDEVEYFLNFYRVEPRLRLVLFEEELNPDLQDDINHWIRRLVNCNSLFTKIVKNKEVYSCWVPSLFAKINFSNFKQWWDCVGSPQAALLHASTTGAGPLARFSMTKWLFSVVASHATRRLNFRTILSAMISIYMRRNDVGLLSHYALSLKDWIRGTMCESCFIKIVLSIPMESEVTWDKLNVMSHDLKISEISCCRPEVSQAQMDDVISKLRKVITPGVESNLITARQAELVVSRLSKYAFMWVNENPKYNGELVKLPVRPHAPIKPKRYSLHQAKLAIARPTIAQWFSNGWIIRSESEYVHPLTLVTKKNGKTRVCVDATGLNKILEYANNNPPKIENLLFEENIGPYYTCLDFRDGFMQIPLHPDSYKLLAFEFEGQIYAMMRLAFGTSVSSSIFNRCARTAILGDKVHDPNIRIYVDDVKIESNCFDAHLSKVESVVENIAKSGMGLSLDKIILFQPFMKYLGFQLKNGVIRKGGKYNLFFDQFNKEHIVHGKIVFRSKREVQKLLGFVNWYGLFVPNLTTLIQPFQSLLHKNSP